MPTIHWDTTRHRQRSAGLLGVAALHALIVAAWLGGRPHPPRQDVEERRFQWVWLKAPAPAARKPVQQPEPEPLRVPERRASVPVPVFVPPPPVLQAVPETVPAPAPAPTEAPEATAAPDKPTAADLLSSARQMAGKVDRQLRKEDRKPLPEFVDTPYKRFQAAVAAAYVPKWTGVPTITEIAMPGTGERIVKVSNGSTSYCLRIPSPGMGIDAYEAARNAKAVTCPR